MTRLFCIYCHKNFIEVPKVDGTYTCGSCWNEFRQGGFASPQRTLRDWFAGMAMQGVISDDDRMNRVKRNMETEDNELYGRTITGVVAEVSYKYADAMMDAREEPNATNT